FAKVVRPTLRDRLLFAPHPDQVEAGEDGAGGGVRETAFDVAPVAQLAIDADGTVVLANQLVRTTFGLSKADVGRPLKDLEISYRPVDLRSAIDQAYAIRDTVRIGDIAWPVRNGDILQLELQISPVGDESGGSIGASVSFLDVTQAQTLKLELARTHQDLETAYEELQSANEELETMNEELQSTNEELRAMNDQLQQRSEDVNQVNDLLESILGSLNVGVAVLEPDLSVAVWSQRAEDLWGLRKEEALGRPFLKMDIGIPLTRLKQPIRDCLAGTAEGETVSIDGVNRRGKPIRCQVTCTLLEESNGRAHRVLLVMAESPRSVALVQ
ncbi:MAG TPA: PAS domain-containing protein, partial [Thermoanaerobaculia bacterium]|nr:PAS domain-containing protein [Thermoanaerobaculia bacterium]